mmetsp:Transcript_44322/g.113178  ORF Transcript_44322/g.113178 Transcript_44322/m.113178 type:complete len:257 (+) Transcript_44322:315-1085(+)
MSTTLRTRWWRDRPRCACTAGSRAWACCSRWRSPSGSARGASTSATCAATTASTRCSSRPAAAGKPAAAAARANAPKTPRVSWAATRRAAQTWPSASGPAPACHPPRAPAACPPSPRTARSQRARRPTDRCDPSHPTSTRPRRRGSCRAEAGAAAVPAARATGAPPAKTSPKPQQRPARPGSRTASAATTPCWGGEATPGGRATARRTPQLRSRRGDRRCRRCRWVGVRSRRRWRQRTRRCAAWAWWAAWCCRPRP